MMKNEELIRPTNTMETIVEYYLNGELETQIAKSLNLTTTEVVYTLNNKNIIYNNLGKLIWKKIICKRIGNSQKLYYALSTMRQNITSIRAEQLTHIMNSFLLSHMNVKDYCKEHNISETILASYQEDTQTSENDNYLSMWEEFITTMEANKQLEQEINLSFMEQNMNFSSDFEHKKLLLQEIIKKGNIRPYWICGQLALHNFSYQETFENTGISEAELELANHFYMETLCTDINGNLLPYNCSYEVLEYVGSIIEGQKCKKKA